MSKLTQKEINKIISDNNLVKIDKNEYKNNSTKILCTDSNGYKVLPTIQHLKDNKKPRPFDKNNPYTIENIKLYLKSHNPNIELLSTKYISSESKLHCKCKIDNCEWYISWDNLKTGQGCPECKKNKLISINKNALNDIKNRLKIINNDLDIIDNEYIDCKTKMNIKCNKGHIFKRNWICLMQNSNCPECSKVNYHGGYNITIAERNKKKWLNRNAIVYIVNIFDNTENFYKIGITNRSVKDRLKNHIPYNYKILYEINTNMYDAVYIENELHYDNNNFKYIPLKIFDGKTECYSNINKDIIEKYINYYNSKEFNNYNKCHLIFEKIPYNLNICTNDELVLLLIRLNSMRLSAKDLDMDTSKIMISGYSLDDWITDIKNNLESKTYKKKKKDLDNLEKELTALLSDDKQTELKIDSLEALLNE